MGKDLHESSKEAKGLFQLANKILGFDISKIMFEGSADQLKETKVTQPAVFTFPQFWLNVLVSNLFQTWLLVTLLVSFQL